MMKQNDGAQIVRSCGRKNLHEHHLLMMKQNDGAQIVRSCGRKNLHEHSESSPLNSLVDLVDLTSRSHEHSESSPLNSLVDLDTYRWLTRLFYIQRRPVSILPCGVQI